VVAAVVSVAPPASAFVRSTTGFAGDTPLAWSTGCVTVAVPEPPIGQVGWDDLLTTVRAAGDVWTQAAVTCGGQFRFVVEPAQGSVGIANDGVNAVVLRTSGYCKSRCDPLSMAITWTYEIDRPGAPDDGRITEADIEINAEAYDWGLGADAAAGVNDLESALVHELGHVLGLDHPCYEPGFGLPRPFDDQGNPAPNCDSAPQAVVQSVLYPESSYLRERRTLAADDERAICTIYPNGTSPVCQGRLAPEGCCSIAGEGEPTPAVLGIVFAFLAAARRSRRQRQRSRY
jgi:MYXO-CTERM domain-containing protein